MGEEFCAVGGGLGGLADPFVMCRAETAGSGVGAEARTIAMPEYSVISERGLVGLA